MDTPVRMEQISGLQLHHSQCSVPQFNLEYEQQLFSRLRSAPAPALLFYTNDPCVVAGRGNDLSQWVHGAALEADGLPLIRRISGGGAVYHDRDCLNYSFLLPKSIVEGLLGRNVDQAPEPSRYIDLFRGIVLGALAGLGDGFCASSVSDISHGGLKISGNAQRISSSLVLHHGTLLLRCPLSAYERYLPIPPNRPGVPHRGFVSGLTELGFRVSVTELMQAVGAAFMAKLNLQPQA
jgi:lipoate---protein ligase